MKIVKYYHSKNLIDPIDSTVSNRRTRYYLYRTFWVLHKNDCLFNNFFEKFSQENKRTCASIRYCRVHGRHEPQATDLVSLNDTLTVIKECHLG